MRALWPSDSSSRCSHPGPLLHRAGLQQISIQNTILIHHPAAAVHQYKPAPQSPHFQLVSLTREVKSAHFTPIIPSSPPFYPWTPYSTLSWPTSYLKRDSHRYEGSVVQNNFTHRQSPMKTGWWDGPLKLQDLSQSNPQGKKYLASPGHQTGTYVVGARPQNKHDT